MYSVGQVRMATSPTYLSDRALRRVIDLASERGFRSHAIMFTKKYIFLVMYRRTRSYQPEDWIVERVTKEGKFSRQQPEGTWNLAESSNKDLMRRLQEEMPDVSSRPH